MEKIVFVTEGMYRGGVETTLINWIETIDFSQYQVTLLLNKREGALLSRVPSSVDIIEIPELSKCLHGKWIQRLLWFLKYKGPQIGLLFFCHAIIYKIRHNRGSYYAWILKQIHKYPEPFDYAISYTMPDSICTGYVSRCIEAKYKWMWSHVDVDFYTNHELDGMEQFYIHYDKIINVSVYSQDTFKSKYNFLQDKTCCIYNLVDKNRILELSRLEETHWVKAVTTILTVGRIDPQKGQDLVVDVATLLRRAGYNFVWYLVGPKADTLFFNRLSERIVECHLENHVQYLGETNNPYSYMQQCDIYVQPSRYEGYCTTITEAKILCKPIIMTNVSGAKEQIFNGQNGIITDITTDALYEGIKLLLDSKELRRKFINNLKNEHEQEKETFGSLVMKLKVD